MMFTRYALPLFLCIVAVACQKSNKDVDGLSLLDAIPATKYFSSDPFKSKYSEIYGKWKVVGTSGGLHGGGYGRDFDFLLVKPNAIFGIVRNDSLLTTGKIEIQYDPQYDLFVYFIPDDGNSMNIELIQDYEKSVVFRSDSMFLYAPCCDRYDTVFKRVE